MLSLCFFPLFLYFLFNKILTYVNVPLFNQRGIQQFGLRKKKSNKIINTNFTNLYHLSGSRITVKNYKMGRSGIFILVS